MYRVDCYLNKTQTGTTAGSPEFRSGDWERVYSEVRATTFELRDPEDEACRAVHVPGKLLAVKFFSADMRAALSEENSVALAESTPSVAALLGRAQGGLRESDLRRVRLREWCVEENTQVGMFGIVPPSDANACDAEQMNMEPVCTKKLYSVAEQ
jgi:hypothetical protein